MSFIEGAAGGSTGLGFRDLWGPTVDGINPALPINNKEKAIIPIV